MARNTIQKQFVVTLVRGFIIKDGQPVEVAYKIDKKCGLQTAQSIIRKTEPTFAAVESKEKATMYKMTFEDFKKYATPCGEAEADED